MGKIDLNYPFMDEDEKMAFDVYESMKIGFNDGEKRTLIKLLALAIALLAITVLVYLTI